MGLGLGLRCKFHGLRQEIGFAFANAFRRPNLYDLKSPERLGCIFKEPSDMCPTDRIMLYARHGHPDGLSKSIVFYEPYGKGIDPISFVLENPPPQEESRKALVYQLMEAGLIPVIIVDERVQEAAESETREFASHPEEGKRELDFWLKFMGVYVPPKGKSIWKARTSARSGWSIGST